MSLVSIQQLRIFSWTEFLESDSRTERVDSRGSVLSFCVHTRQQHNVVTVLSCSYLHIDIARKALSHISLKHICHHNVRSTRVTLVSLCKAVFLKELPFPSVTFS